MKDYYLLGKTESDAKIEVTLTKTTNNIGFGATYSFNAIFTTKNEYGPGIWIIVEFTTLIAPKLNKYGTLQCALENANL